MSRVLILNKSVARRRNAGSQRFFTYQKGAFCPVNKKLSVGDDKFSGSTQVSSVSLTFAFIVVAVICGAAYLFQVNSIATKSFEVRELENKIHELSKENKKMEIREVELRSMYNIEKASKELNLVNSKDVTYIEINGPVAMK